jgi:hypothetical protein
VVLGGQLDMFPSVVSLTTDGSTDRSSWDHNCTQPVVCCADLGRGASDKQPGKLASNIWSALMMCAIPHDVCCRPETAVCWGWWSASG